MFIYTIPGSESRETMWDDPIALSREEKKRKTHDVLILGSQKSNAQSLCVSLGVFFWWLPGLARDRSHSWIGKCFREAGRTHGEMLS